MRECNKCKKLYEPTKSKTGMCVDCSREYKKAWRDARKALGLPIARQKMPREYHLAYNAAYYKDAEVKKQRAEKAKQYAQDPFLRHKHEARWKLHRAINSGRITRLPCEVCGATERIHGHHDDYTKPLDVRWLCAMHHREHHEKAKVEAST